MSDSQVSPHSPKVVTVCNEKVTLQVTVYPKESADTVILLHGGPGCPDPMAELAVGMNQKHRVIYFEQRGTGGSVNPTKDYSMEGYIADIDAIASHFDLTEFHIFGQSWGGLYAQIYAEARPERVKSLFLSSPGSGTNTLWTETEKEVLAYNKENSTDWEFLQMGLYSLFGMLGFDWAYQNLFYTVLTVYHRRHSNVKVGMESLRAIKADPINLTRPNIEKYKKLSTVENPKFPVTITYGDADIYGPSQTAVVKRYPSSEYHEISNCGHIPWIHNAERFGPILDKFYSLENSLRLISK